MINFEYCRAIIKSKKIQPSNISLPTYDLNGNLLITKNQSKKESINTLDLYQIFITHNRAWTVRETIGFSILFTIELLAAIYLLRSKKIILSQAVSGLILMMFLGIVFGSTVFTRMPMKRQYNLELFWSWKEVFLNHSRELLKENLLNCILLFPMGLLLPLIFDHGLSWWKGLLAGLLVSVMIETFQLIFCRGLFEWDDMVNNSLGCMIGCILMSTAIKWKKWSV